MDDGKRGEAADAVDRLQDLLLVLTGRVDDEAVNSTREMMGTGQVDAAAEFLVGCLLAGRIPVTSTEQYHLRRVLDEARSQHTLADGLNVVDSVAQESARFADHQESDADLVRALAPITARLTGVRAVWSVSRVTPAGVTYGAVPRRILLAEVGNDGSVAATGYQLLVALRKAGISCSVDVYGSGADLPQYHREALAAARRVHLDMPTVSSNQNGTNHARAPRTQAEGEPASSEPARGTEQAASPPTASPEPAPSPELPARSSTAAPAEESRPSPAADAEAEGADDGSSKMRVPAAVDAKLTDRERNLLRKLHEELAQREQGGKGEEAVGSRVGQQDAFSTMPGTGGFPPIQK